MRRTAWGVTAILASCAWACSGEVIQAEGGGGAGGVTEGHAQAGQGGHDPTAGEGGTSGEGGASGEGGTAGSWTGDGSAGAVTDPVFPVPDNYSLWNCAEAAGAGGAPSASWPLPSDPEAKLWQLVGDWFHDGAPNHRGDSDYFHFDAERTAWQLTSTETTWDQRDIRYVGTVTLADHAITLDSTAGTEHYMEYTFHDGIDTTGDLPDQVIRYGYSYDQTTDTLYVNTANCTEPVPFVRLAP